MRISKHISYNEATYSNTANIKGIDNTPNPFELENMKLVANMIFEPVRNHFNEPIKINSFFRSKELNKAIRGSSTSQHCKGEAIDVDGLNGITNAQIFHYIKDNLNFTQLIWEKGTDKNPDWVHFSYDKNNLKKQVLRAVVVGGRIKYIPF